MSFNKYQETCNFEGYKNDYDPSEETIYTKYGEACKLYILTPKYKPKPLPDVDGLNNPSLKQLCGYFEIIDQYIRMRLVIDMFDNHYKRREFKTGLDADSRKKFQENALNGNNISAVITALEVLGSLELSSYSNLDEKVKEYFRSLSEYSRTVRSEYSTLYTSDSIDSLPYKMNFVLRLKKGLLERLNKFVELIIAT